MSIDSGETVFLLGSNGSGKTTLLKLILGALLPVLGKIKFDSKVESNFRQRSGFIGYVPQDHGLDGEMTGEDSFKMISSLFPLSKIRRQKILDEVVHGLGLTSLMKKRIKQLSGGQKQLMNIGLGLLHDPKILILDEPFVGLDYGTKSAVMAYLKSANKTIICVSHDIDLAEHNADKIGFLDKGHLKAFESPRTLIASNPYCLMELDFKEGRKKNLTSLDGLPYVQQHHRIILSYKLDQKNTYQVDRFLQENEEGIIGLRRFKNNLRAALVGSYGFSLELGSNNRKERPSRKKRKGRA